MNDCFDARPAEEWFQVRKHNPSLSSMALGLFVLKRFQPPPRRGVVPGVRQGRMQRRSSCCVLGAVPQSSSQSNDVVRPRSK